jgi:hypothetical protein
MALNCGCLRVAFKIWYGGRIVHLLIRRTLETCIDIHKPVQTRKALMLYVIL